MENNQYGQNCQAGDPMMANQQYSQPQYGQPQYGQQQYGQPQYDQPQYGQTQYAQPQYGQPEQPQYDQQQYAPEQPQYKNEEEEHVTYEYVIRKGFIIKTYGILLTQLAITCIFISLTFIPSIKDYVKNDLIEKPIITTFFIIFLIVTIVVCVVFSCFRDTARTVPYNYILLFAFTLCMSFYCFLLCSFFNSKDVISAALLTFGATVGLTIYAARTKTDFTYCGAFLFAFLLILIFSAFLFFWVRFTIVYLLLGVCLYALYLIYDTQLILGDFGNRYNIDDYCLAALNLYIDIIYMFIKILQIIASMKGN